MIAKLIDVQCSTYVNFAVENNDIDPKSEVANRVRISKYKKSFATGYHSSWSEEAFVIKKVKKTLMFMKKNCKKYIK